MECGVGGQSHKTPHFHPRHRHQPPEWPSLEEPGSSLTASSPVLNVCAPACRNGLWPPLRPVSVAQKNKPSIMLSAIIQSIDLPMDCMDWRFWTMRQPNGWSTPAPRSSAAKQWFEQLTQKKKKKVDLRLGRPEARLKRGPLTTSSYYHGQWTVIRPFHDQPRIRSWDCYDWHNRKCKKVFMIHNF